MLMSVRENTIEWQCKGGEEDELCSSLNTAMLDDLAYNQVSETGRGAVIALPPCQQCGAQTFLKADYSIKELCKVVQAVQNEQGVIWAYVLPLRYVRNLRLHWMLYEQGKAEHAPVLPMPPQEVLEHPQFAQIEDRDSIGALWFGYLAVRERTLQIGGSVEHLRLIGGKT